MFGATTTGVRSYADEEWVVNVDVSVGVGGKWTWRVSKRDGHVANGNGSTSGSSVGSSKRGLRMGRGDMYGARYTGRALGMMGVCTHKGGMRGDALPQAAERERGMMMR